MSKTNIAKSFEDVLKSMNFVRFDNPNINGWVNDFGALFIVENREVRVYLRDHVSVQNMVPIRKLDFFKGNKPVHSNAAQLRYWVEEVLSELNVIASVDRSGKHLKEVVKSVGLNPDTTLKLTRTSITDTEVTGIVEVLGMELTLNSDGTVPITLGGLDLGTVPLNQAVGMLYSLKK